MNALTAFSGEMTDVDLSNVDLIDVEAGGPEAADAPSRAKEHGARGRRHAYQRFGRHDGERVFRAAVRHSRHVRILRIVIPCAIAALLVVSAGLYFLLNPLRMLAKLPVDVGSLVVSGSKIMMQQPRVAGFTKDNRRYVLTAQAAGQDVTKPDFVELHGIHATLEMQDQDLFDITAQDGLYNAKTELMTLTDKIFVTSKSGYRAELSEAVVDMKGGRIVSQKPVHVSTAAWDIRANAMDVAESGNIMRFDRGVTVVLAAESKTPEKPQEKAQHEKPQQRTYGAEARSR
jgi:lipopolysaccharide export system protein LptC